MALFDEQKKIFDYEIAKEGEDIVVRIFLEGYPRIPSVEDDSVCMSKVIDIILEVKNLTKIIFYQKRNYEYDPLQTDYLKEIAKIYAQVVGKGGLLSYSNIVSNTKYAKWANSWYAEMNHIVSNTLKSDPIGAYLEIKRLAREERIKMETAVDQNYVTISKKIVSLLTYIASLLEKTKLIQSVESHLAGYNIGDRSIYRLIFSPSIKPDFMFTKLMATYPLEGEELDNYIIEDNTEITIFSIPETIQYLYHMMPPEFKLTEDQYEILDTARKIMAEHKPKKSEFVEPDRMRQVFSNVGHDLIEELMEYRGLSLRAKDVNSLTKILVRYTVGFGLIELLLADEKVQDITINSPMGEIPIFLVHQEFDDCRTNIIPTTTEAESWASKLRMISGRPLDEANPILDTEINLPTASARVAVISEPLNPTGLAYAFRRHRDKPWTLPLFIKQRMINPMAAGLISFLVDGARTMLVAGTRSAGKSSLLGSVLVEIMRKYRIITIEDTLELPTSALRKLGYNIQPMKVAAAMTKGTAEVSAEEGIRSTLRMGDSCLIVGEVRSTEAKSLYEAMRVGALANVVAGTIHGDSPYGVFDRVVNDLGIPRTSFKATDIVIVANPIKSADGLHRWRRVTQITEIRKQWEQDPLLENGFVDLMKYDSDKDELLPSSDFINGDSEILKGIAGNVKEWAGDWDAIWNNILLRAKIKEKLVKVSDDLNNPNLLEAEFVVLSNDQFHRISDKVKDEVGSLDPDKIYFEWEDWLKRTVKKFSMKDIM